MNIENENLTPDLDNTNYLGRLINNWRNGAVRTAQLTGDRYYEGLHDILSRRREAIGEDGKLTVVDNLPNNRIVDNQYAKMVNQKVNYLLGQPIAVRSENDDYVKNLNMIFDRSFMRTMKKAGKSAVNNGISWLYAYYDNNGELKFRCFSGSQILPVWADTDHKTLTAAVRLYTVDTYDGNDRVLEKVEVYSETGVKRYDLKNGSLKLTGIFPYAVKGSSELKWSRIPLIPIRYNEEEQPLIKRVKSLQDGINIMLSDFENNMQEDARNTILVLKGYDGENLGEFRRNLTAYGAVKVSGSSDERGGVDTLQITVTADNYKAILELFKKALIEGAMGYDAKDDRLSGNPNQMNIQSMYSDIDLDANGMETELQAAFDEILWFVNAHLANSGKGDFDSEKAEIIFNRDILINEGEAINNCIASLKVLSEKTVVAQHPWVDDIEEEMKRIEEQRKAEMIELDYQFGGHGDDTGNADAKQRVLEKQV